MAAEIETENVVAEEFLREYKSDILALSVYIPYFTSKGAKDVSKDYDGEYGASSLNFPVFDSMLLSFVKKAQKTKLMDRNYPYVYSRNNIRTHDDERKIIAFATIRDIGKLRGILSRYVLEGNRIASRWSEGAEERIYLEVLEKLKELVDFYS
ncbi:hypothetical protein SAMN05216390_10136 [Lachnospiraceae bacterium KH1T2]|nr:hypothetical protein SAMN05216390_10136 [Lachnospiraceae bacterium KH1T2]